MNLLIYYALHIPCQASKRPGQKTIIFSINQMVIYKKISFVMYVKGLYVSEKIS